MYLLLTTQGVDCEIGTKFDQYQMTKGMGDVIQTDLKLNKGLKKWQEQYNVEPTTQSFDFNTCLGIAKAVANAYSVDYGFGQFKDSYAATLEGVSQAFLAWNPQEHSTFKHYVRTCCQHAVWGENRKIKRWNKEISFTQHERTWQNQQASMGAGRQGGSDCTITFEDSISNDTSNTNSKPLWVEESLDPEDKFLHKEEIEVAKGKVASIIENLNEREHYVLFNHILDEEPETLRDMADQFQTSKDSILRDKKRLLTKLQIGETK